MNMTEVVIKIPENMECFLEENQMLDECVRNAMILYPYIQNLTISHGRAAELLGISKTKLIDIYCSLGIPYLNYSVEEVEEEIATYKRIKAANS